MVMDGEPNRKDVHTARHRDNGVVRQSEQEKPWPAKMANPVPEFRGYEQSGVEDHDGVAVAWGVEASATLLGGSKLRDLEKVQWSRGWQYSAFRSVMKEKLQAFDASGVQLIMNIFGKIKADLGFRES